MGILLGFLKGFNCESCPERFGFVLPVPFSLACWLMFVFILSNSSRLLSLTLSIWPGAEAEEKCFCLTPLAFCSASFDESLPHRVGQFRHLFKNSPICCRSKFA